jgi:hypothetical protein
MKVSLSTHRFLSSSLVVTAIALLSTPARAVTFNFQNIFPANSPSELSGDPFVDNFSFDVSDAGSGKILFEFINSSAEGAIGDVYLENPDNLLSNMKLNVGNVGNVNFKNISPGNLPQGNKIGFNEAFGAKFSGGRAKQVSNGESLGITFTGDYNDVIDALENNNLRVGIHIQGIFKEESDSFVSEPVPEPLTIIGSVVGLSSVFAFNRRSNNRKARGKK